MKLYTKTGDDGTTGLFGGERVGKDHPRVEAYGSVDELNAALGVAAAACDGENPRHARLLEILHRLQSRMFDVGADLATPESSKHGSKIARVDSTFVAEAEAWIDEIDAGNDPLTRFVLPGGTDLAARLHLARAVCRRAERRLVAHAASVDAGPEVLTFLNRTSDLLFAMARRANKEDGVADVPWEPGADPGADPGAGA